MTLIIQEAADRNSWSGGIRHPTSGFRGGRQGRCSTWQLPSIQPARGSKPLPPGGGQSMPAAACPWRLSAPLCSPLGIVTLQLLPALARRGRQLLILALFRSLGSTSPDFSLFFWWHFHVTLGEKNWEDSPAVRKIKGEIWYLVLNGDCIPLLLEDFQGPGVCTKGSYL